MPKKISLTRIPINRGGYDRRGRYFGIGLPLYQATDLETDNTVEFRAADRAEAVLKVDELMKAENHRRRDKSFD